MIVSLRSELLRLRKRPAAWILLAIILCLTVFIDYLLGWIVLSNPPPGLNLGGLSEAQLKASLYPTDLLRTLVSNASGLAGAIMLIIAVLVAGSDYGWGTWRTILTQGPGRVTAVLAKAIILVATSLLLILVCFGAAALTSWSLATADGASFTWPSTVEILRGLGAAWLVTSMYAALGLCFALVFRQSALAIGLGLVYMLVLEGLVLGLLGNVEPFRTISLVFPGSNATAMTRSFHSVLKTPAPLVGAVQAAAVMAAYTIAFIAVGAASLRARDVA